jgi:DNA-binding HxlR family transcriptional regulator
MKGYGQFCSIARALDLIGERWTLLVVRELLCGSRTFGDFLRGLPRISRTMLAARLRELVDAGVIVRRDDGYELTEAGQELFGVVRELGTWGQKWLPRTLPDDELDLDVLLFDMRRRVNAEALPPGPTVVRIEAADLARSRPRWLLLRAQEVSLCSTNPGFPEAVTVRADRRTLVGWWRGDISFEEARRQGLSVDGPKARAFPGWFQRYLFAGVSAVATGRGARRSRTGRRRAIDRRRIRRGG